MRRDGLRKRVDIHVTATIGAPSDCWFSSALHGQAGSTKEPL